MVDDQTQQAAPQDGPAGAAPNKAQEEFAKYQRRMQAQPAGPIPGGVFYANAGPSWAVPPSIAMLPPYAGAPPPPTAGSLTEGLGASLRLGIDLINAALAGGVRILGGFADAYGHEDCGCESCCEPTCCEPDCCDCDCCHPGVGNCC
ncbi:MAG TPA: hypothetical protein VGI79_17170 [Caulobacteraceae bacterium]|jgi:hypothetical protein